MAEVKVKLLKGNELSYARTSLYYTSLQPGVPGIPGLFLIFKLITSRTHLFILKAQHFFLFIFMLMMSILSFV
jgi:hypothetical protein